MENKLSYQEWVDRYGSKFPGNGFEEAAADFKKLHGLNLFDEIDKINQMEYRMYLQKLDEETK